jgi:hypothetical protein
MSIAEFIVIGFLLALAALSSFKSANARVGRLLDELNNE